MKYLLFRNNTAVRKVCSFFFDQWQPQLAGFHKNQKGRREGAQRWPIDGGGGGGGGRGRALVVASRHCADSVIYLKTIFDTLTICILLYEIIGNSLDLQILYTPLSYLSRGYSLKKEEQVQEFECQ